MKRNVKPFVITLLASFAFLFSACDDGNTFEDMGDEADDAIEDATD